MEILIRLWLISMTDIIFFDIEMCCWEDKSPGEIIEISLVRYNTQQQNISGVSQYYITPQTDDISSYCTQLTGITPQKIQRCGMPFNHVIQSIKRKYGKSNIFCSWGRDDLIINKYCIQYGIVTPIHEFINGSKLFNMLTKSDDTNKSMYKMLQHYQIPVHGKAHNGLDDAINLSRLISHVMWPDGQ